VTPGYISEQIVTDRMALVKRLLRDIRALPLGDYQAFLSDRRNVGAAESCLRRSLEALFDIGRHILAKGYGIGVAEYKEIARRLQEQAVLSASEAELLSTLAGHRNYLVHFYHEVTDEELYSICSTQLGDIETLLAAILAWMKAHPEMVDQTL